MTNSSNQDFRQIGMLELIRNMLSPRTLPHILMIAVISSILLFLVDTQEVLVATAFISLALSYVIIALLSNIEIVQSLTKLPPSKVEGRWIVRFLFSFRITIVPILLASIIVGVFWSFTGGNSNGWISPLLASLFIVWSIAQAASFRTGMVEWLANGLGDAKLHTYQEKISTASQVILVQLFALIILWLGQIISQSEKMTLQDAILGGFAFIIISIMLQAAALWITRSERESSGNEKGMAAFSFKWMIVAQLFITWHAFSIYRRTAMSPSEISTLIEEGLLMAFTVIFAVWSLTTYTVRDGKRLISEHASLPLGISFGYAYAGSVAMLTGTFDNLKEVMIFGHILSICAMMLLLRPTIRTSRMTSEMFLKALNADISSPLEQDTDSLETEISSTPEAEDIDKDSAEEWQEDDEIDWEKGVDISENTDWNADDSDVEVAESD